LLLFLQKKKTLVLFLKKKNQKDFISVAAGKLLFSLPCNAGWLQPRFARVPDSHYTFLLCRRWVCRGAARRARPPGLAEGRVARRAVSMKEAWSIVDEGRVDERRRALPWAGEQ
jgi:hypothetical protein